MRKDKMYKFKLELDNVSWQRAAEIANKGMESGEYRKTHGNITEGPTYSWVIKCPTGSEAEFVTTETAKGRSDITIFNKKLKCLVKQIKAFGLEYTKNNFEKYGVD